MSDESSAAQRPDAPSGLRVRAYIFSICHFRRTLIAWSVRSERMDGFRRAILLEEGILNETEIEGGGGRVTMARERGIIVGDR